MLTSMGCFCDRSETGRMQAQGLAATPKGQHSRSSCMRQAAGPACTPPHSPMLAAPAAAARGLRLCSGSLPRARRAVPTRCSASSVHPDVETVLLTREQIAARVQEVGR